MAANYVLESVAEASQSREVIFAGDNVRLAGQIDYPVSPPPRSGYPFLFVIHHAGGNTRADFEHYAQVGLECGFAVFRWDKRGTGRSGAGGRGSTLQDAVNAYKVALSQPGIDRERSIILAQGEGTLMLSDIFKALANIEKPEACLLIANLLDKDDILMLDTQVQIIIGAEDWISWRVYGKSACDAHNEKYGRDANFSVAHHADRLLIDTRYTDHRIHIGAKHIIKDWLYSLG